MTWSLYDVRAPLPEANTQPRIKPIGVIAHSIVGSARSAMNYFRSGTNLESHGVLDLDGTLYGLIPTTQSADANYRANRFVRGGEVVGYLSIETADNGDPNRFPWTDRQVDRLVKFNVDACRHHRFTAQRCPRHGADGFGYHSMHGAPSDWTPVRGKTCPGTVRIEQWNDEVLPRTLKVLKSGGSTPSKGNDPLMALSDAQAKKLAADAAGSRLVLAQLQEAIMDPDRKSDGSLLARLRDSAERQEKLLAEILAELRK